MREDTARRPRGPVALVEVDDGVLEALVGAATADAAADDVTPRVTAGPDWTEARVTWLRDFHESRRSGLTGPEGEVARAVVTGDQVVGSVRLRRTEAAGVLETGIWLTRSARGQGIGRAALRATLTLAASVGAESLRADTTAGNAAALSLLRELGFELTAGTDEQVTAELRLDHRSSAEPWWGLGDSNP